MTWWAWWNELVGRLPQPEMVAPAHPQPGLWALELVAVLAAEKGRGETTGNNQGPDVDRYRTDVRGVRGPGGPWCAALGSWGLEQSWSRLHARIGGHDFAGPCPIRRSHSAKRLFLNALKFGAIRVEVPIAGDLVLWHRGKDGATTGHFGVVDHHALYPKFSSWEGNKGSFPSVVDLFTHAVGEHNLLGFARLP